MRQDIGRATELSNLTGRGDAALTGGSFGQAVTAYSAALALAPNNVILQDKLAEARMRQSLDQARDVMNRGDLDAAQQIIEAAQVVSPEAPALTEMLAAVNTQREYNRLMTEADTARDAGDFGKAKRLYRNADQVQPGEDVALRLEDTEYREWVAKARQSLEAGAYDAARAMLRQAQRIRQTPELDDLFKRLELAINSPNPGPDSP